MDAHWPLAFQRSKSSSSDKQVAEALRYFISDSTYSGSRSACCNNDFHALPMLLLANFCLDFYVALISTQ